MFHNSFHIQNIFDALNCKGTGVNGHLKLKCLQLQNRSMVMADSGDIVAVSADCPEDFCRYIMKLKKTRDVTLLRFNIDEDLRSYLNSSTLFSEIDKNELVEQVKDQRPLLQPYMHSAPFYETALQYGWQVPKSLWEAMVKHRVVELMNDKEVLYKECKELDVPVPKHWVLDRSNLAQGITNLLENTNELFIRQARSGGGLGNTVVRKVGDHYLMEEVSTELLLPLYKFQEFLDLFVRRSYSERFLVSELLDLYASPGTLFYTTDSDTHILAHTYQILTSRRIFTGFMYPITDTRITVHFPQVEDIARNLVESWRERGFRGYGNIDWMITTDNKIYIAERNARQTAVVAPLTLLSNLEGTASERIIPLQLPKNSAIFTKDTLHLSQPQSFESVVRELEKAGLLYSKTGDEGIVITIPPLSEVGASQLGIMSVGHGTSSALATFNKATHLLEKETENTLFPIYTA